MSFSEKIFTLRSGNDLTQVELAKELGVFVNTISNWECGKANANMEQLNHLADFFHVSVDFLLDRPERADHDILSIQRAMDKMEPSRKQDLKTILTIAFSIDFGED